MRKVLRENEAKPMLFYFDRIISTYRFQKQTMVGNRIAKVMNTDNKILME